MCASHVVHVQVKHKGARRISFEQFVTALAAIAETKQVRTARRRLHSRAQLQLCCSPAWRPQHDPVVPVSLPSMFVCKRVDTCFNHKTLSERQSSATPTCPGLLFTQALDPNCQVPLEGVAKKILQSGGPASTGTRAQYVKWFDDKVSTLPFYS